jgi:hypothetical protein
MERNIVDDLHWHVLSPYIVKHPLERQSLAAAAETVLDFDWEPTLECSGIAFKRKALRRNISAPIRRNPSYFSLASQFFSLLSGEKSLPPMTDNDLAKVFTGFIVMEGGHGVVERNTRSTIGSSLFAVTDLFIAMNWTR